MSLDVSNPELATVTHSNNSPNSEDWTNGMTKAPRNVAWYQATLTRLPETAKQIFREYSGIPEDKILDHIHRVRDKAWDM